MKYSILEMPNKKCLHCDKAIVAIGNKRANGGMTNDWETRKYHKKCFKEIQEINEYKRQMERLGEFIGTGL